MSKIQIPLENISKPTPASFFLIVSYESEEVFFKVKEFAENSFSKSMYESIALPKWVLPDSDKILYTSGNLTRILSFTRRIHREELPSLFKECLAISKKLRKNDPTIRLIPGYMTSHNVVIASAVDDFHRMYLFHGVYGEIVYKYFKSQLIPQEVAPSFFHSKEALYFFANLRDAHEFHLKKK